MRIIRYLLAAFVLCGLVNNAQAKRFSDHEADTVRGHVTIERKGDSSQFEVKLEDKVIFTSGAQDGVVIEATYPAGNKPKLLLLKLFSGNACEGFFRVVDLRVTQVLVSEEFGNCYYLVPPKEWKPGDLKENPTYYNGVWHIAVPSSNSPMTTLTWFYYDDGKIYVAYKDKLISLDEYDEVTTQEIINYVPPPDDGYGEFCIAKDSLDPEAPPEKMIDKTLSWINQDLTEQLSKDELEWRSSDSNHDGMGDWFVYSKDAGVLGNFGSVYLSSPAGSMCPTNSWCYAGSGYSFYVYEVPYVFKCEDEYIEFTMPEE